MIAADFQRIFFRSLGLAAITLMAYWPSFSADFINYDDPDYVYENSHVLSGLTPANTRWAFTTFLASNWHPLTWLSLQNDAFLFGIRPVGFHFTNVIIHLLNVILLFRLLKSLTSADRYSWMVAALFAVHPLHVESVAWVSERKDVLSSFFGLAALLCYVHYVKKPSVIRYLAIMVLFVFSLLAKPMWVTFPAQIILLDIYPLRRFQNSCLVCTDLPPVSYSGLKNGPFQKPRRYSSWLSLIAEKLPFVALTFVSCILTLIAQRNALKTLSHIALPTRLANAIVAIVIYLKLTVWPVNLAPFYPYSSVHRDWSILIGSGLAIAGVTGVFLWKSRWQPGYLVGWLWFLGTLTPVLGIVQVGGQAYADRYTYVPHMGLFAIVVWLLNDGCDRIRLPSIYRYLFAGATLFMGICLTRVQVGYWQSSETLWRHTLAVTPENSVAYNNLGTTIAKTGKLLDAVSCFEQAVNLQPDAAAGHFNLGNALKDLNQPTRAEKNLRESVRLDSGYPGAQNALGVTLAMLGKYDEAIAHLREATRQSPKDVGGWFNLGATLAGQGKFTDAIPALSTALTLRPNQSMAQILLAWAEYETGDLVSAQKHYQHSMRIDPHWPVLANRDAWMLATNSNPLRRNGNRALQLARRVCQATDFREPQYLDTLAAAYAETGHFSEAVTVIEKAIGLLEKLGATPDQIAALKSRRESYVRLEPYHQATP